ncbi:MAG TPA: hypothetical protein VFT72_04480 [Opitutaceae bacterium]|nr:hypothetical protein [Opitutaceae bacterium]
MSGSWLATQGRLPLAFMGLALAWLAVATLLLAFSPGLLALPHVHPRVVALTHAWVLGFFVSVACGAVYQLAPVALGTTLASERHGWWHFGLHAAGVPGMVFSFWFWDLKLLGHFGTAVALGILLFSVNVWRTVRQSGRTGVVAASLVLSAGWILLTVVIGLLLAANRFWGFIPLDPAALLRAHAHLGLVGFLLTLLQGVSFQLVPMFTLGEVRDWRLAKLGQWLVQGGLLVLAPALAWHLSWIALIGAGAIASGVLCSAIGLGLAMASRKKRQIDIGLRVFLFGGIALCAAAIAGVILVAPGSPWGSAPGGFGAMVYAVLALGMGLLPCIAGMLCKIVPFLTWMRAYGPHVGRGRTPSAGALTSPRLERAAFTLQGAALIPLLAGTWLLNIVLLRAGAWLLVAGVAFFLADMLGVMRHLWRPELQPAPTSKST